MKLPESLPRNHLLALLLVGTLCVFAVFHCVQWARREEARLTQARAAGSRDFERRRADEAAAPVREQQRAQYEAWRRHGVIGPARRIEWIEAVHRAARASRVPSLDYELGPAQALPGSSRDGSGVYASPMTLRLALLHEGQLLDFLHAIEMHAGMLRFGGCEMKRLASRGEATLEARCTLDWMNMQVSGEVSG